MLKDLIRLISNRNHSSEHNKPCIEVRDRRSPILDEYIRWEGVERRSHAGHAFNSNTLRRIEEILPKQMDNTAETGCGKSTILFSNISRSHWVFALDDRTQENNSSVLFYEDCPITNNSVVKPTFGPTQETLLRFTHEGPYDAVLIDGPHGWPFPEFEYMMFYPHIKPGGYLILDDVNIPTIGRMADILAEDEMWDLLEIVDGTAIFKRTEAETFSATGDGWWTQKYNRKRVSAKREIFLNEESKDTVTSMRIDNRMHE